MIHIFISFLWSGLNEAHCTNENMKVVMQACFFVLAWWELCWETGNEGESWGLTWKCSHKQTKRNFFNKKTKLFIIIAPGLFIFLFWRQRIISENWSYVFISWLVCLIYCAHFRFCFLLVGTLCRPSVHSLSEPTSYDLLCWLNCRLWGCGGNDHVRDNHPFSLMSHRSKSRKNFLKHELLNHWEYLYIDWPHYLKLSLIWACRAIAVYLWQKLGPL